MPASPSFPVRDAIEEEHDRQENSHLSSRSNRQGAVTSSGQPRRRRVDSVSSIGSSVAPAAPPYRSSRSSTRKPNDSGGKTSSSAFRLGAAYKSPTGDGLDNWLLTQTTPSGAPADRVSARRQGSEAGSIGAWSAGVKSASGRRKRRDPSAPVEDARSGNGSVVRQMPTTSTSTSRRPMPDFEDPPTYSQPQQRHSSGHGPLDSLQEWRETSAVVAGTATSQSRIKDRDPSRAIPAGSHSPESTVVGFVRHRKHRSDREPSTGATSSSAAQTSIVFTPHVHRTTAEPSPLRRIIRWLAKLDFPHTTSQRRPPSKQTILVLFFVCGIVRWAVGLGSWSGRGVEPMHGDFEAQRHWLELTYHLPTSQWYFYDLPYWGLDYPPLTAWHSLLCAKIGNALPSVRPSLALFTSRGAETPAIVTFMRSTVLVSDYLTFLPAVLFFLARRLEGRGRRTFAIATMSVLLQPSIILVDHGHFQYNCVMLGFSTLAFAFLFTSLPNPDVNALPHGASEAEMKNAERRLKQRVTNLSRRVSYDYVFAAVAFTFSLGFKQMALFYAPAIFAVMVGRCWGLTQAGADRGLALFSGLALWTVVAFLVQFYPWLSSLTQMGQIVHRVFPLARGIFEDKVANAWCFLSVLPLPAKWKLRNILSVGALARLSTLTTLAAIIPPCVHLFLAGVETVRTEMALVDDAKRRAARRSSVSAASRRQTGDGASVSTALMSPTTQAGTPSRNSAVAPLNQTTPSSRRRTRSIAAGSEGGQSELGALLSQSGIPLSQSARLDSVLQERERAQQLASRPVASSSPSPAALVLPYALLSTSLAFYLFGFQTHEKTVLLPLLPLSLLMGAKGDEWGEGAAREDWEWGVLGNNVAVFSMFPLLQRDGLTLQYVTLTLFWNWAIGYRPFSGLRKGGNRRNFVSIISATLTLAMLGLHLLELLMPRLLPALHTSLTRRYPDLFAVLNVLLCAPSLGLIWSWSLLRQVQVGFACGVGLEGVKWLSGWGARLEANRREGPKAGLTEESRRRRRNKTEREKQPPLPVGPVGDVGESTRGSGIITAEAAAGI